MTQETLDDFETSGVECPNCERSFSTRSGLGVHHSHSHDISLTEYEKRQGEYDCPSCPHSFETIGGMKTHHVKIHDESLWGVEVVCDNCGDTFNKKPSNVMDKVFCDKLCESDWKTKHGGDEYTRPKKRTTSNCKWCGNEFEHHQCQERIYCSMECKGEHQSKRQRGPNNPYWRGGRDFYTRIRANLSDTSWPEIAERARKEYNHECFHCGLSQNENGRKLDVHHIVPVMDGGTNGLWNLIPLCNSCHKEVEWYTVNEITGKTPILSENNATDNKQCESDRGGRRNSER